MLFLEKTNEPYDYIIYELIKERPNTSDCLVLIFMNRIHFFMFSLECAYYSFKVQWNHEQYPAAYLVAQILLQ